MDRRPIGIFDSGVGGLTVLSALKRDLPGEDYIVLGDTKNNPYGVKSPEEIGDLSVRAYKVLKDFDIKAMVIGCNTATVNGLEAIEEIADIPIIGIIDPGVSQVRDSGGENLLILATEATVKSGKIQGDLEDTGIGIQAIAAPDMVQAVEGGNAKDEKGYEVVKSYLDQASGDEDTVILSCTHFPAMRENIEKYYQNKAKEINIIDPANGIVDYVKDKIDLSDKKDGTINYYTTGDPETFKKVGNIVLGGKIQIQDVNHI